MHKILNEYKRIPTISMQDILFCITYTHTKFHGYKIYSVSYKIYSVSCMTHTQSCYKTTLNMHERISKKNCVKH